MAIPGGELEYAVLSALWEMGSASARELHSRVGAPAGLVYTTVAKVLDRLFAKGLVQRHLAGKAFLYRARIARPVVEKARARRLLGAFFGDSPRPTVSFLVEAIDDLDPDLLKELSRAVSARRKARRGS